MADYTLSVDVTADSSNFEKAMRGVSESMGGASDGADIFAGVLKGNLFSGAIFKGLDMLSSGIENLIGSVVDVGKGALDAYSSYEQLAGGVKTIFDDASQTVMDNAARAFQTAGLSANDYMDSVMGISAALKQSTGDNLEAAKIADMAMQDISDNANKMGTDISSIQTAYQGFARGQYQLLDNLKLGYGGTKEEMQRLLSDAQALTGVEYNIDNLSDVYNAIHAIQENLGITGTTAQEAMTTIEGSANMTRAAWENLLTAIGTGEGLDQAMDDLFLAVFGDENGGGLLNNVIPVIGRIIDGIGEFVSKAGPMLAPHITPLLQDAAAFIQEELPKLKTYLAPIFDVLKELAPEVLPIIGDLMLDIFLSVLEAIGNGLLDVDQAFWNWVADALTSLTEAGVEFVGSLIDGAMSMLEDLGSAALDLAAEFVDKVLSTDWLGLGTDLLQSVIDGILDMLDDVTSAADQIGDSIWDSIQQTIADAATWGWDIISGIADGIWDAISNSSFGSAINSAAGMISDFLGFSEPEKGPLSKFHTFMPDMIDLMTKGMQDGQRDLAYASAGLAGTIAGGLTPDGIIAGTGGGYYNSESSTTNSTVINLTVNGSEGQSARQLADEVCDEIMRRMRRE